MRKEKGFHAYNKTGNSKMDDQYAFTGKMSVSYAGLDKLQ